MVGKIQFTTRTPLDTTVTESAAYTPVNVSEDDTAKVAIRTFVGQLADLSQNTYGIGKVVYTEKLV